MGNTPQSYSSKNLEAEFPLDPSTTTGQLSWGGWPILTWAGFYDRNGNWTTQEHWTGFYDNDGEFAYGRLLSDYQTRCPTTDHTGHALAFGQNCLHLGHANLTPHATHAIRHHGRQAGWIHAGTVIR